MKKKLLVTVLIAVTIMTTSCAQKIGKTIAINIVNGNEIPESLEQETGESEFSKDKGRILVYLDGTDSRKYLCAYDEKFNLIWGPLKAKNYPYHIYTDGVLIMTVEDDKGKNHSVALDIDGNQIFEFDALGYSDSASHYSEGALRVEDENGNSVYCPQEERLALDEESAEIYYDNL